MKNTLTRMAAFGIAITVLMAGSAAHAATPVENQKFLSKLYGDLLHRAPSRIESATFTVLLNLGVTRTQVAGSITSSKEYRSDQIQQYFGALLNRPATSGELSFYLNYLQQGASDDDVKGEILGGDEYYRRAGATDHAFLNKLFQDVLGRTLDGNSELTFATLLRRGTTRQVVAGLVLRSLEADQREVSQLFQSLLQRMPQPNELATFAQMLQTGGKDEYVIDLLCGNDEYFQLALK